MRVRLKKIHDMEENSKYAINDNFDDLEQAVNQIELIHSGQVENVFGAASAVATPASAGETFTIAHGLKRVPDGILVIRQDAAGTIYVTNRTATTIELACDEASVNALVLVI